MFCRNVGVGGLNKASIQSIVCVAYAEIPNRIVGLLCVVCVVYAKFLPMSARKYNFHSFIE